MPVEREAERELEVLLVNRGRMPVPVCGELGVLNTLRIYTCRTNGSPITGLPAETAGLKPDPRMTVILEPGQVLGSRIPFGSFLPKDNPNGAVVVSVEYIAQQAYCHPETWMHLSSVATLPARTPHPENKK